MKNLSPPLLLSARGFVLFGRIFSCFLLFDFAETWFDFDLLLSQSGAFPQKAFSAFYPTFSWNGLWGAPDHVTEALLILAMALSAILAMSRFQSFLVLPLLLLTILFMHRMPGALTGSDIYLQLGLWALLLLPKTEVEFQSKTGRWKGFLLLTLFMGSYWYAGISKIGDASWHNGLALFLVLKNGLFSRWSEFPWELYETSLRGISDFIFYAEIVLPPLCLALLLRFPRARFLVGSLFFSFHFLTIVFLNLGILPFLCLSFWILILAPAEPKNIHSLKLSFRWTDGLQIAVLCGFLLIQTLDLASLFNQKFNSIEATRDSTVYRKLANFGVLSPTATHFDRILPANSRPLELELVDSENQKLRIPWNRSSRWDPGFHRRRQRLLMRINHETRAGGLARRSLEHYFCWPGRFSRKISTIQLRGRVLTWKNFSEKFERRYFKKIIAKCEEPDEHG